ncbi:MAG: hypothetical protein RLZZ507_4655 [Cyanobacteriota bacterium]|jgi:hypothetical protein
MKSKKFLIIVSLTATLATAQIVGLPNQKSKEAQAQSSSRSNLVFVGIVRNNVGNLYRFSSSGATSAGNATWRTCPSGTRIIGLDFQPNGFWLCASPDIADKGTWYFGNVVTNKGYYWEILGGKASPAGDVKWDTCWEGQLGGRLFNTNGFWFCRP